MDAHDIEAANRLLRLIKAEPTLLPAAPDAAMRDARYITQRCHAGHQTCVRCGAWAKVAFVAQAPHWGHAGWICAHRAGWPSTPCAPDVPAPSHPKHATGTWLRDHMLVHDDGCEGA